MKFVMISQWDNESMSHLGTVRYQAVAELPGESLGERNRSLAGSGVIIG